MLRYKKAGYEVSYSVTDVANEADMLKTAKKAHHDMNGVDMVCANTGIYPDASIDEMTTQQWNEVSNTNLKGIFLTIKCYLPYYLPYLKNSNTIT